MAIRKVVEGTDQFEKDVFAVDITGKTSAVVISKQKFTLEQKQNDIARLDTQIASLEADKVKIQADITAINAI